jgi:hypothetical protein
MKEHEKKLEDINQQILILEKRRDSFGPYAKKVKDPEVLEEEINETFNKGLEMLKERQAAQRQ